MYPYNIKRNNRARQRQESYNAKPFMVFAKNNSEDCDSDNDDNDSSNQNPPQDITEEIPETPDSNEISKYVIEMIKQSIKDECIDAKFYDSLANSLSNEDDKRALHKIHHDEEKHKKIFIEIYNMLTGSEISVEEIECDSKPLSDNIVQNFENALYDEINSVEFYRKLYFIFLNNEIRDALFEVITDEQSHADIMNLMYSKYQNTQR